MSGDLKAIIDSSTYRIKRKIAEGGMGTVYEGLQVGANGFEKTVAIKTISPKFYADERVVDMFIHEAKLVADLVHENIVQIYQLGRTPDEGHYIVMEYVRGLSLHDLVQFQRMTETRLPVDLAVFIASRICRGLAYAHTRRDARGQPLTIVHRDVCPNNILITTEGLPKLTDFGIAVAANRRLNPRSLMGKAAYMSPEQAMLEDSDFRSDQFSLGAVLFEMLSGHRLRQAGEEEDLFLLAKEGRVDWERLPDDTPSELVAILRKCLAPERQDRYAATDDLARELEYFIYKDGYGPTIQALEAFLKKQFPYLYQFSSSSVRLPSCSDLPTAEQLTDPDSPATLIMDSED